MQACKQRHPSTLTGSKQHPDPQVKAALADLSALRSEIAGMEAALDVLKGPEHGSMSVMGHVPPKQPTKASLKAKARAAAIAAQNLQLEQAHVKVLHQETSCAALSVSPEASLQDLLHEPLMEIRRACQHSSDPTPVSREDAQVLSCLLDQMLPPGALQARLYNKAALQPALEVDKIYVDMSLLKKEYALIEMVFKEATCQVAYHCSDRAEVLDKLRARYAELMEVACQATQHTRQQYTSLATRLHAALHALDCTGSETAALQAEVDRRNDMLEAAETTRNRLQDEFDTYRESADGELARLESENQALAREVAECSARIAASDELRNTLVARNSETFAAELSDLVDERNELQQRVAFLERQLDKARERQLKPPEPTGGVEASMQTDGPDTVDDPMAAFMSSIMSALTAAQSSGSSGGGAEGLDAAKGPSGAGGVVQPFNPAAFMQALSEGGGGVHTALAAAMAAALTSSVPAAAATGGANTGKASNTPKQSKRDAINFGGFAELVQSNPKPRGKHKTKMWALKCIAQIYADKAIDDRNQQVCEFVYDWHMTRYGLRNMAEINLADLIATVQHYAAESPKICIFGQFCSILPDSATPLTPDFFDFYMFAVQQLSTACTPPSILTLFPDVDSTPVQLNATRALDAVRALFRAFDDPDRLRDFLATKFDPMQDMKNATIEADALMAVVLTEYKARGAASTNNLKALFVAADSDRDRLLRAEDFQAALKCADPSLTDKAIKQLFQDAKDPADGPAADCLDEATFLATARKAGYRHWRIDYRGQGGMMLAPLAGYDSPNRSRESHNTFTMLQNMSENTNPNLASQMEEVRQLAENASVARLERSYSHFQSLMADRSQPEAAWLAYRMLTSQLQSALSRSEPASGRSPLGSHPPSARSMASARSMRGAIDAVMASSRLTSPAAYRRPTMQGSDKPDRRLTAEQGPVTRIGRTARATTDSIASGTGRTARATADASALETGRNVDCSSARETQL
ncbi:hypothetical protein WJX72_005239 [[Myrmecia] bisecta]|uniref:EF-hand domain-containing protein n=1 Tax=[Myrmecia] bisecta TaxID=41462 RepID=A0AAW1PXL2_9CHLO